MEEKKLTDEEIVKALEHCATENTCRGCVKYNRETTIDYFKCMRDTRKNVVDLIHRLQSENERLNDMKFTQEHCDLYKENELLKAELSKELAEHEEFTKKAKDEIGRLNKSNKELTSIAEYQQNLNMERWRIIQEKEKENAELQKQVDYLTNAKGNALLIIEQGEKQILQVRQQAVKDTADEIYDFAKEYYSSDEDVFGERLKEFVKRYGVEVEG